MRILRVIRSVDRNCGGPIEGIVRSSKVLAQLGHNIEMVCLDAPESACVVNFPLNVHAMGPAKGNYGYSKRYVPWLCNNLHKYDVVLVHGIWQYSSFGAWRALRRQHLPYLVYPHGMLDPWFKKAYPLKHMKKWLYWPWGEYRVLRDAQAVLFTCEQERVLARESFWLYKCNEVVVNYGTALPLGDANAQREQFWTKFPELRQKPFVLFLGRLHAKKGCDLLLAAFAEIAARQDLRLVMAGPDQVNWQRQLVKQARKYGIDQRITWTGMLTGDVKWGAFKCAQVFVLPSHQENFGLAVVEALACGLPVLISNKVNIWREIQQDGAGFVADDTLEGTLNLLTRWLQTPDEDKQIMSYKAEKCFRNRFEIGRAVDSLLAIIAEIKTSSGNKSC